jgi:outer membrane protein assembly factor BamE (lipoprotein component of BamABCDE complex)
MKLVPLAQTSCGTATCPGVFEAPDGSVVVQGYVVPRQTVDGVPEGEARVQIPRDLLIQAARSLPDWEG